ncbi:MAG: hypothetical protein WCT01_04120 [Candidatus Shapirobacteria bacterium]
MKLPSLFNISVLAFVISVFSLSFLQVGLQLNSSSQVLGQTTQTKSIVATRTVPCSALETFYKDYCPTKNISPIPTTSVCKTGVSSFSVDKVCNTGYLVAYYGCYDGFSGTLGDGKTCYASDMWQILADKACYNRSSCSVRPTYAPTPTLAPYPTMAPWPTTGYVTPTPPIVQISIVPTNKIIQPTYSIQPTSGYQPPYNGR